MKRIARSHMVGFQLGKSSLHSLQCTTVIMSRLHADARIYIIIQHTGEYVAEHTFCGAEHAMCVCICHIEYK